MNQRPRNNNPSPPDGNQEYMLPQQPEGSAEAEPLEKIIDDKIKVAEAYLPELLEDINEFSLPEKYSHFCKIICIISDIKSRESIMRKILYRLSQGDYEGMSQAEILEAMPDILRFTVVINRLDLACEIGDCMYDRLMRSWSPIEYIGSRFLFDGNKLDATEQSAEHITNVTKNWWRRHPGAILSKTGYEACNTYYRNIENGIRFEIQFTDPENLKKRDRTHDEYVQQRYGHPSTPQQPPIE